MGEVGEKGVVWRSKRGKRLMQKRAELNLKENVLRRMRKDTEKRGGVNEGKGKMRKKGENERRRKEKLEKEK
jgi:hypothetical protein